MKKRKEDIKRYNEYMDRMIIKREMPKPTNIPDEIKNSEN